jgi:hypothetical protein
LKKDTTVNVLQVQILENNLNIDDIIDGLRKKTKFLRLKSFKIDNDLSQYNFWFDLENENYSEFISFTQKLVKENKKLSIDIYSRAGIYE